MDRERRMLRRISNLWNNYTNSIHARLQNLNPDEPSRISLSENDMSSGSEESPILLTYSVTESASFVIEESIDEENENFPSNYLSKRIASEHIKEDFKQLFQSFRCCICFNLAKEPVNCTACLTIFCKDCADRILNERKSCPIRCAGAFSIEKINRKLQEIYLTILVVCPYGCGEYINVEERSTHHRTCSEVKFICKNPGCGYKGTDIESHKEVCEHRRVACRFCGEFVRYRDSQEHLDRYCKNVTITCKRCNESMKRGDYISTHQSALNENVACLKKQLSNLKEALRVQKQKYDNLKRDCENETNFLGNKRKNGQ